MCSQGTRAHQYHIDGQSHQFTLLMDRRDVILKRYRVIHFLENYEEKIYFTMVVNVQALNVFRRF